MYNESWKEKYLEKCDYANAIRNIIREKFNKVSEVERKYQCDLSDFNKQQVSELEKSGINFIYLAEYTTWCKQQGYSNSPINHYDGTYFIQRKPLSNKTGIRKILNTHSDLLDYMNSFSIEINDEDELVIIDGTEGISESYLNKERCLQLSNLFKVLAENL